MRIPKWLLVGLLLTGGTHQVCGDFRSHLSSPAVVLPEPEPEPAPANTVAAPAAPAAAPAPVSAAVSSLLSNLLSSIITQDATPPPTQTQTHTQTHQGNRGKRKGKQGMGKGKGKGKSNKVVGLSASITQSQSQSQPQSRVPGLEFLLRADPDDDSWSSSEDTGPVDNMLNEDADILAAQENLSVGAMSSAGLDQQHTSSSSDEPSPAKIPNLAQQLLAQAQHNNKQTQTPTPTQTSTQPKQAALETTPAPSIPTQSTETETETETDSDTDADADAEGESETETEPETQPLVSYSLMSRPPARTHTISMSPFVRLTIATGRDSRFSPSPMLGFGSDPLQQVWAELRASLRQDMMSMWRESLSPHGSSQVMRVFPIGPDARVSVIHIHDEPAISQHPCRADAQRWCASEMSSHNMLDTMACLGRHESSVSEQCAHEIAHCPAMACAQDVQQLCAPDERVSRASVMECLTRHHDQLSTRCQAAAGINSDDADTTAAAVETESHTETTTPTSASPQQGSITPLSAFGWVSSSDATSSSSSSSSTSPSVSASVVVGLTILALLLMAISGGLYAHLRRISREPQLIKLEHVHDEEEMQHA